MDVLGRVPRPVRGVRAARQPRPPLRQEQSLLDLRACHDVAPQQVQNRNENHLLKPLGWIHIRGYAARHLLSSDMAKW